MSELALFQEYAAIADRLIEAASKEQLAECARILALNVAHYKARFGDAPVDDLNVTIEAGTVSEKTAAMLASGMENMIGVLGTVMGLDQPEKLN